MKRKLMLSLAALICICASAWAQKPKTTVKKTPASSAALSKGEKMGYQRTNKYWGPGTYYAFAPGVTHAKMINTQESAMRDLTGISREDCLAELNKQGFVAVPPKEVQKWYGNPKDKPNTYFYAPGKSYVLKPGFAEIEVSPLPGDKPFAAHSITRSYLLPKQDSLKVIEMVWQFIRDLKDMKVLMGDFRSTFKKADEKAYPAIQQVISFGWNGMRAGCFAFALKTMDGKLTGVWNRNEDIIRRTIGNTGFDMHIDGLETDFSYSIHIMLQKEGYAVVYGVGAGTFSTIHQESDVSDQEPGSWTEEHKRMTAGFSLAESMDKQAIELYKKYVVPPVLEDLNKVLHIQ